MIPSRVNSDVVENMICQQRTLHNGANTNPTMGNRLWCKILMRKQPDNTNNPKKKNK